MKKNLTTETATVQGLTLGLNECGSLVLSLELTSCSYSTSYDFLLGNYVQVSKVCDLLKLAVLKEVKDLKGKGFAVVNQNGSLYAIGKEGKFIILNASNLNYWLNIEDIMNS